MCAELLPPGGYPIALNKHTISYIKIETLDYLKLNDFRKNIFYGRFPGFTPLSF
jgi:hypothetical protein